MNSWNGILQLSLKTIEEEHTKQFRPNSDTPKTVPDASSYAESDENESDEKDELTVRGLPLMAGDRSNMIAANARHRNQDDDHTDPRTKDVATRELSDGGDGTITLWGSLPVLTAQEESKHGKTEQEPDEGKPSKGVESDGYETESICSEDLEYMYGTLPMDKLPSTPKTRNTKTAKRSPDSVIIEESSSRSLPFLSITPHDWRSQYDKDGRATKNSNSRIRLEPEEDDDDVEDDASALSWI